MILLGIGCFGVKLFILLNLGKEEVGLEVTLVSVYHVHTFGPVDEGLEFVPYACASCDNLSSEK